MSSALDMKILALRGAIANRGAVAIGFSGGIDSAFLAKVAFDSIGDGAVAITVDSSLLPRRELDEAKELAFKIGIRHSVVKFDALLCENVSSNPRNRCYFCKKEVVKIIAAEAKKDGVSCVAFGATVSDLSEYRPGIEACEELNVWQPLLELKFTKEDVRAAAKEMGIPVWHKPAAACLASRISTGDMITEKKLRMIEDGEEFLRSLGFELVRVRMKGNDARIEVALSDVPKAESLASKIAPVLQKIGFESVKIDRDGYRPGGADKTAKKK